MKFLKGTLKVLGGIIAVFLTAIYITILLSLSTITTTKDILTEKNINQTIKNIDFLSLPANDILGEEYGIDKTIKEAIEEELEKNGVDRKITNEVIASEELTDFLSSFIARYINYILYNENKPTITEQEVKNVISIGIIENATGLKFDEKQRQEFDNFIKATVNEINKQLPTKEDLNNQQEINNILLITNQIMSEKTIRILVIALVILFLIIALCRFSLHKALIYAAISNILVSLTLIGIYLIQKIGLKRFVSSDGAIDMLLLDITDQIFKKYLYTGITIFIVGIFIIIIYKIIKKLKLAKHKVNKNEKTIIDE